MMGIGDQSLELVLLLLGLGSSSRSAVLRGHSERSANLELGWHSWPSVPSKISFLLS